MSKIVWQSEFFVLGKAASLGEGKLWIQTRFTPLKNWLCVVSWQFSWVKNYIYVQANQTLYFISAANFFWVNCIDYSEYRTMVSKLILSNHYYCVAILILTESFILMVLKRNLLSVLNHKFLRITIYVWNITYTPSFISHHIKNSVSPC